MAATRSVRLRGEKARRVDSAPESAQFFEVMETKKSPAFQQGSFGADKKLEHYDVSSLKPLGTLLDGELHFLSFLEVLETITPDGREVDEDIGATIALDEAETLCAVEPFNRTDYTIRHFCLLSKIKYKVTQSSFIGQLNKIGLKGCALSHRLITKSATKSYLHPTP
jgi:hypothetical protein